MTAPLVVLAEDHFGGALALGCAIACSVVPLIYVSALWIGARIKKKSPKPGFVFAALLAVIFGIGLVPYWLRFSMGDQTSGVITSSETKRRSAGRVTVFTITLDDGRTLEESVEHGDVPKMEMGRRVAIREVPAIHGFERLGDEATLSEGTVFGSLIVWGLLATLTVAFLRVPNERSTD